MKRLPSNWPQDVVEAEWDNQPPQVTHDQSIQRAMAALEQERMNQQMQMAMWLQQQQELTAQQRQLCEDAMRQQQQYMQNLHFDANDARKMMDMVNKHGGGKFCIERYEGVEVSFQPTESESIKVMKLIILVCMILVVIIVALSS